VVVELRGDDVVLARESWGVWECSDRAAHGEAEGGAAALVGDEAPAAIGGQQGVDEHE
jgi:hypothetical protein